MNKNRIGFFISKPPLRINYDKWELGDNKILLVTGLVGSGKTTLGSKYAELYGGNLISFDALKFYNSANEYSKKEIDEFVALYPEIIPLIKSNWFETDDSNKNDLLYKNYCILFYEHIIEKYKNSQYPIIIEGIQLFVRIPLSKLDNTSLYILRTSAFKSCIRYIKRDHIKRLNLSVINQLFTYHIKQTNILNNKIKLLTNKHIYQKRQST